MRMSEIPRTAEHVSSGHPDKYCDQVADRILDEALRLTDNGSRSTLRTAIECLGKQHLLVIAGEARYPEPVRGSLDYCRIAKDLWRQVGFGEQSCDALTVIDYVHSQSPDIAHGSGTGVDAGGAGDQGIMIGYATDETPEMMPDEWVLARDLCWRIDQLRESGELPWLRATHKTQVSLGSRGDITSVIIAAHHGEEIEHEDIVAAILEKVVRPTVDVAVDRITINGTGRFVLGGLLGDAGVVGRKLVVDAYGPRIPIGGGAFSGKDPTKVDRSAAYFARHIAKTIVGHRIAEARECTVQISYGIGKCQPETLLAVTDRGEDVSGWVRDKFPDATPRGIIDQLGLFEPEQWSYCQTASYGHFGRDCFPWERIADV